MSKGIREAPGKALIGELAAASGDRPEGAFGEPETFTPDCKARAVLCCALLWCQDNCLVPRTGRKAGPLPGAQSAGQK